MPTLITHPPAYDDMLGYIITGLSGANQWNVKNIRDTLFPLPFLRNNSSDFYCTYAQSPHTREQGKNLASIHVHYLLDSAYTGNQTLVFDLYYTWAMPNTVMPALSGWQRSIGISITLSTGNLAQYHMGIFNLVTNVAPPTIDGYGAQLLFRIVRGNGTYTGELGIFAADAHMSKDRYGSNEEYND